MAGAFYTPDEIDAMPMQDVLALFATWRECPPTHEILAAVHNVRARAPIDTSDPSGIGALIARAPDGRVGGSA